VTRVAVQLGTDRWRMAIADPRPRLLADLQVPGSGGPAAALALSRALLDRPADELVVVHGPGGSPVVPAAVAPAATAVAPVVRFVPGVVAALGCVDGAAAAGTDRTLRDVVVVDAGRGGTEVARLVGGRVVASRRVPVGGAVLDAVTADLIAPTDGLGVDRAEARAAREALSLQPVVGVGERPVDLDARALRRALVPPLAVVVDAVRVVLAGAGPGRPPPVLLVGGVARTPLLAELLDAAGVDDVRVAPHPDSAAVVGALRLPPHLLGPPLAPTPVVATAAPREVAPAPFWLPPVAPVRNRLLRTLAVGTTAVVAVAGLYSVGAALPATGPTSSSWTCSSPS
jgi:hypothetical protein